MRQVFYIEADEEMISVIGRIRRTDASEIVLVMPHRALILQSIVNLRLLGHDARKYHKEIVVVTQDEQSQILCEKAGIRTQDSLEEDGEYVSEFESPTESGYIDRPSPRRHPDEVSPRERYAGVQFPYSSALGSDDFSGRHTMDGFAPAAHNSAVSRQAAFPASRTIYEDVSASSNPVLPVKKLYGDIRHVSVRDNSPKKLTTLNSHRFVDDNNSREQKSFIPPSLRGAEPVRPLFMPAVAYHEHDGSIGDRLHHASGHDSQNQEYDYGDDDGFLALEVPKESRESATQFGSSRPQPKKKSTTQKKSYVQKNVYPKKREEIHTEVANSGNMHIFFIFFGVVCALSIASVFAYMFLPKADITVKMKPVSQKADYEFNGSLKNTESSAESRNVPIRLIEKDQDVIRTFDATGKTSLADQKSRGTVTIINNYSAERQALVATTRLQAPNGKIFRLVNTVVVPGKKSDTEPGSIDAAVIADQSGSEYNIEASTFTIPGFSGSPKQDKFSAKSTQAMVGGGVAGSDVTVVSEQDIAKAKKTLEADLKKTAADTLQNSVSAGEKILSEAVEATIVSSSTSPQIGVRANTFELRTKIHVKAFAFSETDLKKQAATLFAQKNVAKGPTLTPDMIDLQYGEPSEDFTNGTMRISAHAVAHYASELDQEQLKSDLLGQNSDDIAVLLQKYTQIDTISVELWPNMIISKIPNRESRVNVIVEQAEGK